jgi:hypothetical protein
MINKDLRMNITDLIEQTYKKITAVLDEKNVEYLSFDNGAITISFGSTQVMVVVREFTNDDVIIECMANVVTGATISPELMRFLLRKNAEIHFGAFGLLFDDTIVFSHALNGANMNSNELLTALHAVSVIADHYDDEIVAMAGGHRAADLDHEL